MHPEPNFPVMGHEGLLGVLMIEQIAGDHHRLSVAFLHQGEISGFVKKIIDKHLRETS